MTQGELMLMGVVFIRLRLSNYAVVRTSPVALRQILIEGQVGQPVALRGMSGEVFNLSTCISV